MTTTNEAEKRDPGTMCECGWYPESRRYTADNRRLADEAPPVPGEWVGYVHLCECESWHDDDE